MVLLFPKKKKKKKEKKKEDTSLSSLIVEYKFICSIAVVGL